MQNTQPLKNGMSDYTQFPSTRYQGSKRRLLPWLKDRFEKIEFTSGLDIFGGTGVVSYLLKTLGKEVTFNDYLRSNCVSASALVKNNTINLNKRDFDSLFGGTLVRGIVYEIFKGIFYTDKENELIDTLIHRIQFDSETRLNGYRKDIALHTFFQALLMKRPFNLFHRANLYIRTNEVERSFGNKTTWETPLKELMERIRVETNKAVFNNGEKHRVLNLDALLVSPGFDLVYIDPPYYPANSNTYINYLDYYHFLEGICMYEEWRDNINFNKKTFPLKERNRSFKKQTFIADLSMLLENHQESIIIMSYKSPGFPSLKQIKDIMKNTHKNIKISSTEHFYSLNKNNGHYRENLIYGFPKS